MDLKHLLDHGNTFFSKKVFAFKKFSYSWKILFIVGKSPDCGKVSWLWEIFLVVEKFFDPQVY